MNYTVVIARVTGLMVWKDVCMMEALRAIVGADHLITDPELIAGYATDWTGRFTGEAQAVVRPASTQGVSEVLRVCHAEGIPVVIQGGNTGLVGGAVPTGATAELPIILTTTRMNWIGEVDPIAGQVSAGAGATLAAVQAAARKTGWFYGVDLAARDTATIGGTVATNAGGIRVLAYGMTRHQLVGIEAVLADGQVLSHMSGLAKDNTGFDLAALLCGSEGSLAVITAVRVSLHPPMTATTVAVLGVPDYAFGLQAMRDFVIPGHRLVAAEIMDATGLRLVQEVAGLPPLFETNHPFALLLEVEDDGAAEGFSFPDSLDVVIAADASAKARLWRYREAQADAFATLGVLHKLDVSVPLPHLQEFAVDVREVLERDATVTDFGIFGHIGDGNLHVEFCGPDATDERVDAKVLACVNAWGGAVSAEHGIGQHKTEFLHLSRSEEEIAAMRALKYAWDPDGLLNPGVLFPCGDS